ncbi:hypothetical protein [Streptomyces sp. WAC00469]|uniref:hypothetical protein n=1 Tax=Streptomyces sp. WAC00469 TaxID=2487415 RepID=UPI000F74082B|nr:hypothetical protein [Streptomyces sp. WAC00469]RSS04107.1 hypothetical protein EF917_11580 [Streptomyces sp. WAC00469]
MLATADRLQAELVAVRRASGATWADAVAGHYSDVPSARRAIRRALDAAEREHEQRLHHIRALRAKVFGTGGDLR